MDAASYLNLRIQELVIHDWDMRSGGTGQAAMDSDGVNRVAAWFRNVVRPMLPFHCTPAPVHITWAQSAA